VIHRNRGSNQKWRTREKEFKQQVGGISERCWKDSQGQPQGTTGGNFGQRARFFMLNWRLRFLTAPTAGAALRTSALRIDCAVVNILDFYLDSGQKSRIRGFVAPFLPFPGFFVSNFVFFRANFRILR